MKKWLIPAVLAVVTAVVVAVVVLMPSEEQKVKKTIERLALTVAPRPQANPAFELARINDAYKDILADRVEISIPEVPSGIPGSRRALAELTMTMGARYGEADVDVSDVTVKLDDSKTTAQVDCTAELRERGGSRREKRRVHFALRNDDHWRITSINVAEREGQ
jgi:hypothetical protein